MIEFTSISDDAHQLVGIKSGRKVNQQHEIPFPNRTIDKFLLLPIFNLPFPAKSHGMVGWITSLWWKLNGWKINGTFPDHVPKMVIAVGPHTSAWDIVVGLAARYVTPIHKAYFLGKKELFDGAFGWFFRALGGTPVDRSSSQGMVAQVADKFKQHDVFRIAMSPEGTRKKVEKLRTGFYYIAKEANVPIQLVGFDFKHKQVIYGPLIHPSNDEAADFKQITSFFAPIEGKIKGAGMRHLDS